jgi:hypothetical protein
LVEIHIYGKLRRYAGDPQRGSDQVVRLEPRPVETLASLLAAVAIPVEEIHVSSATQDCVRTAMEWTAIRRCVYSP